MPLPDWAMAKVVEALERAPVVEFGTVLVQAQLNYAGGGLGSVKVKVSDDAEYRPPKNK